MYLSHLFFIMGNRCCYHRIGRKSNEREYTRIESAADYWFFYTMLDDQINVYHNICGTISFKIRKNFAGEWLISAPINVRAYHEPLVRDEQIELLLLDLFEIIHQKRNMYDGQIYQLIFTIPKPTGNNFSMDINRKSVFISAISDLVV